MLFWEYSMNLRPFAPLGKRINIPFLATKEIEKVDSPVFAGRRLSLGRYKTRQLGSLQIEGCRRSTAKPSVLGTD
jgi:hypothetical protein